MKLKLTKDERKVLEVILKQAPTHGQFDIWIINENHSHEYKNTPDLNHVQLRDLANKLYSFGFIKKHDDIRSMIEFESSFTETGRKLQSAKSLSRYYLYKQVRTISKVLLAIIPISVSLFSLWITYAKWKEQKTATQDLSKEINNIEQRINVVETSLETNPSKTPLETLPSNNEPAAEGSE